MSNDLNRHIGECFSWSPRNLLFMRQLVNECSNLNQPGSEIERNIIWKDKTIDNTSSNRTKTKVDVVDNKASTSFYNAIAKTRDSRLDFRNNEAQYFIERYRDFLPRTNNHKALVLGSGTGKAAFAIEKLGFEVTGIDCSYDAIQFSKEIALEIGSNCSFIYGDFSTSLMDNTIYDLIILPSNNIIECSYSELIRTAALVKNMLTPNGFFCIEMIDQLDIMRAKNKLVDNCLEIESGRVVSTITIPSIGQFEYETYFWTIPFVISLLNTSFNLYKLKRFPDKGHFLEFQLKQDKIGAH